MNALINAEAAAVHAAELAAAAAPAGAGSASQARARRRQSARRTRQSGTKPIPFRRFSPADEKR